LRYRFNAVKQSIMMDTFPKVMELAFPGVSYSLNKTDFFASFDNGSEIWFSGLDDKDRVDKILGKEYATMYFNEVSEIPLKSVDTALTRLAQKVIQTTPSLGSSELIPRAYFDLNPPTKSHWTYKRFHLKVDPASKMPLVNPGDYVCFQMNPKDNAENLSASYIDRLTNLSEGLRRRFLLGQYGDDNPNALFSDLVIDKYRVLDGSVPEFIRIVIGVDPSGASDDSEGSDAIGIVVGGLGVDGCAYLIEDCTVTAGPATWGRIATNAFDRHAADCIVGEVNYGGAMVKHVIQTARPQTPYREARATRGKHVRIEPLSALYEQGKIKHIGYFPELEEELCAFSTIGYTGADSPNRADAWAWVMAELFPGVIRPRKEKKEDTAPIIKRRPTATAWMGR
jgi:hypothetical protein